MTQLFDHSGTHSIITDDQSTFYSLNHKILRLNMFRTK